MIICFDTETTGDGPQDQVIELAARVVDPGTPDEWKPTLVQLYRPTVPINVEARAVHHIRDTDLAFCPTISECPAPPEWMCVPGATVAAHHLEFDMRLMLQTWPAWTPGPGICTWRCARHIWPRAPRHQLQVLRYWLDLNITPPGSPHRASYDAQILAALVRRMLSIHTAEELLEMTTTPALLPAFPFGEHKGKPMAEVPMGYIDYMLEKPDLDVDVRHTLETEKARPDRTPLLLETCHMGKHRGTPWAEVPRDYLRWIASKGTFDPDTQHTVRHHIDNPRP